MELLIDSQLKEMSDYANHDPMTSHIPERVLILWNTIVKIKSWDRSQAEIDEIKLDW